MLGTPPYCRPECLIHADCPTKLACLNNKCRDPCIGSCGLHAQCTVVNHQPVCTCEPGYHGDPFSGCSQGKILMYILVTVSILPSSCLMEGQYVDYILVHERVNILGYCV